jgi:RHH-type proline utilization regulon transcriptional repressor/proline dehydrogenase/delta 1-pyrroline-5-carboxylate dehydrogenase
VKWNVKPGSYTFKNELFAPLLSVVCIDSLEQGIAYANSSEYGLTAGLQSLNEEEQALWKSKIEAGNLYINRGITGAIVRRQPFGGMKRSAFGAGIKAGGPNYVSCFLDFTEKKLDKEILAGTVFGSYLEAFENEFSQEKDVSHIYGEENIFRYLHPKRICFRIQETDDPEDIHRVLLASYAIRKAFTIRLPIGYTRWEKDIETFPTEWSDYLRVRQQTDEDFIADMHYYERIRACSNGLSDAIYQKAAQLGIYIADAKPLPEGRLELLHYFKEQSISREYHRYGSIFGEQ